MTNLLQRTFKGAVGLAVLLAVMTVGSAPAWAQVCESAATTPDMVRAEGITEEIGEITIRCVRPATTGGFFDATVAAKITISVQLNTDITNAVDDDRKVAADDITFTAVQFTAVGRALGNALSDVDADLGMGTVSEDGRTITWEADTDVGTGGDNPFNLRTAGRGFSMSIAGILADASMRGHDEEITAVVSVNGSAVHAAPFTVSEVENGLDVTVMALSGLQCLASTNMSTAMLTIKEAAVNSISDSTDATTIPSLVVSFSGIPMGVSVTVPNSVDSVTDEDATTFAITSVPAAMSDIKVSLTDGAGKVSYAASETIATGELESVTLTVTFEWDAGAPTLGMGMVSASYHPVGGRSGTRYSAGTAMDLVTISDCTTSLLFPFVTNMYGYDTGIALANPSAADGSCTLEYSGMNAPTEPQMEDVMAGMTKTFGVSMMAPGFQGLVTASCDFLNAEGFAFIANGFGGMGGPTAAQGYLAVGAEAGGERQR